MLNSPSIRTINEHTSSSFILSYLQIKNIPAVINQKTFYGSIQGPRENLLATNHQCCCVVLSLYMKSSWKSTIENGVSVLWKSSAIFRGGQFIFPEPDRSYLNSDENNIAEIKLLCVAYSMVRWCTIMLLAKLSLAGVELLQANSHVLYVCVSGKNLLEV